MGNLITTLQNATIPEPNKKILQVPIGKIRTLHKGFQMLCETFALNQKEFEQIFSFDESIFALWDTDSNGLIDSIEFFCALVIFSNSRVEDKIRFLFEFFDFNEQNFLEETDIQFLTYTCINSAFKIFAVGGMSATADKEFGEEAYERMVKIIKESFPEGMRVNISDMLKWTVGTLELKEFFTYIEILNQRYSNV